MRNAFINQLFSFAQEDRNVILISGDLGFGVLDHFHNELSGQYFNAGICEQNMASMAAGLAIEGKKVYLYSIGNFPTLRCIEQIRNDICYHNANVKIISVGGGFAYGALGMSHHATEDIAMMRSLPRMEVYAPCDPVEAAEVAKMVYSMNSPCYIRLNKGGEPVLIHEGKEGISHYDIRKMNKVVDGDSACIITTGAILGEAIKAAEILKIQGISVAVYSLARIKPMDRADVISKARKYDLVVTLEEHNLLAGFGSAIAELFAEIRGMPQMIRLGIKDEYTAIVGSQEYLRKVYGLDGASVAAVIAEYYKKG